MKPSPQSRSFFIPPVRRARTRGYVLYRVPLKRADGRSIDKAEARLAFADQPWAKSARFLTTSSNYHVFERPEDPR